MALKALYMVLSDKLNCTNPAPSGWKSNEKPDKKNTNNTTKRGEMSWHAVLTGAPFIVNNQETARLSLHGGGGATRSDEIWSGPPVSTKNAWCRHLILLGLPRPYEAFEDRLDWIEHHNTMPSLVRPWKTLYKAAQGRISPHPSTRNVICLLKGKRKRALWMFWAGK
jgi:hypothetical protein